MYDPCAALGRQPANPCVCLQHAGNIKGGPSRQMRPTIEILIRVAARGHPASLPILTENYILQRARRWRAPRDPLDVLRVLQTRSVRFGSLESLNEAGTVGLARGARGIVGGKSASPNIWQQHRVSTWKTGI